jgi:hypothetical protein
MFKKDDRVIMIKSDPWAKTGWIGTVAYHTPKNDGVRIMWDNGCFTYHNEENLDFLDDHNNDPNILFMIQKRLK